MIHEGGNFAQSLVSQCQRQQLADGGSSANIGRMCISTAVSVYIHVSIHMCVSVSLGENHGCEWGRYTQTLEWLPN